MRVQRDTVSKDLVFSVLGISISTHASDRDSATKTSRKLTDPTSDTWTLFTTFDLSNFNKDAVKRAR